MAAQLDALQHNGLAGRKTEMHDEIWLSVRERVGLEAVPSHHDFLKYLLAGGIVRGLRRGDLAEADKNLKHLVIRLYMLVEELLQITERETMQKLTRTSDTWSSGCTCWLKNYNRLLKGETMQKLTRT